MTTAWLRVAAIAIGVAGVIDPSITAVRHVKPEIALVASPRLPDSDLIDRVARSLDDRFTVIRGASIVAAATVSVGYQLPELAARNSTVGFAVLPEPRDPFVAITAVDTPPRVNLHAQAPIKVGLQTFAARGQTLTGGRSDGSGWQATRQDFHGFQQIVRAPDEFMLRGNFLRLVVAAMREDAPLIQESLD